MNIHSGIACDGLESISGAFSGCASLEGITIPSTVKVIGEKAFSCCTQLRILELCDGLESINAGAFYGCTSLIGITSPSTVKVIGEVACNCCTQLRYVELCDGLESICLLYTSPSPRDLSTSRMPSSA